MYIEAFPAKTLKQHSELLANMMYKLSSIEIAISQRQRYQR